MSLVRQTPAAQPETAHAHFQSKLVFETDCWDVHASLAEDTPPDFILLDVRSPDLYDDQHIPGAVNLPIRKIIESKLKAWPEDTLFVVYCAGPHCNGADKAALRLSALGRSVKLMIGGMTGWADEGFDFATST